MKGERAQAYCYETLGLESEQSDLNLWVLLRSIQNKLSYNCSPFSEVSKRTLCFSPKFGIRKLFQQLCVNLSPVIFRKSTQERVDRMTDLSASKAMKKAGIVSLCTTLQGFVVIVLIC